MSDRCHIQASDDVATFACEDAVGAGLSPLRAVISGYFALAGYYPGVLLGPVALVVHGLGLSRAFDGRLHQPGVGARRPRGFVEGELIPQSAYMAAPRAVPALFVALGYDDDRRNSELFKQGLTHAKREGAPQRHWVLSKVKELGARAFAAPELHRPLVHVGGASEGGLLGAKDFEPGDTIDLEAASVPATLDTADPAAVPGLGRVSLPWQSSPAVTPGCVAGYIAAIDRRGMAVLLRYERVLEGIEVGELDLVAPRAAIPVRRGQPRVRPGEALGFYSEGCIVAPPDGAARQIQPAAGHAPLSAPRR